MSVDYAKANRIHEAIEYIWNRIDQIDKELSEIRYSQYLHAEETRKGLLEERRQLFETYQEDLKELAKCYMEEPK